MEEVKKKSVGLSKPLPKPKIHKRKVVVSKVFIFALSIVSILGFIGIISQGFFEFDLTFYVEAFLMFIIGAAMIAEAKVKKLLTLTKGFNSSNFTSLVTTIIGLVAVVSGILSFPPIRFENVVFFAVKGILSVIAIVIIIVQTWIIKGTRMQ